MFDHLEGVVAIMKDVQVRQVNGGFVVILSQRAMNKDGNAMSGSQTEHVALDGATAAKLIAEFLA